MKIKLADGREAVVGVAHVRDERGRRGTRCWLRAPGLAAEALTMCSAKDNFCKRTGRRIAAARLLARVRESVPPLGKEDRAAVFLAVCPEYGT